jgi:CHAD domain-containing protein
LGFKEIVPIARNSFPEPEKNMPNRHLLSHALSETWAKYEKQVRLSRDQSSIKNIHRLRVSTQKLEAVLTLANSIQSNHNSKNVIYLIKKVRKSLGPLRDIQVESLALGGLSSPSSPRQRDEDFTRYFTHQKSVAKKKANRFLKEISLKRERNHVGKLVRKLMQIEEKKTSSQIHQDLHQQVKSSLSKLNEVIPTLNPERIKEIHQFRIQAKKLRYQGECLNSLSRTPSFDLKNLKVVQSVAGRIQNDSILLRTLDQFLAKKKHSADPSALNYRTLVLANQKQLIERDFKQLGSLKWKK